MKGERAIPGGDPDEQERWAALAEPPPHERTGEHRWTQDAAKRAGVERRVDRPVTSNSPP
ncbi:DUF6192 family protein [Nonomuraea sp. CA-141351]|uniref:DUF6192 family protein n=1 Tax=Nonomuraea sp. CA-141351 TaxID=3239996 RepID=UPI003D90F17D